MKKYVFIAVALVIAAAAAFALLQDTGKVLNVSDVGTDPAAFTGTITFTGIMAAVSPQDKTVIGVMDVKELQCKSANCNRVYIPVRYTGEQPVMGDEIKATGRFQKTMAGFTFIADKIKVVKNHKIGG